MEKKTKKKFGILAVALVLLLAIGATIGTTLAKYVTDASIESEQATVAQWGVTVSVDKSGLFGKTYNSGSIVATEEGGVDVKSTATVVAPGTSGVLKATVNGQPQVKSKLTFTFEVTEIVFVKYSVSGADKYYYPIEWSVGGEKVEVAGADALGYEAYLAALKTAINAKIETQFATKTWEVGASISESLTNLVSWNWALNTNDVADTLLGDYAAGVGTDGKTVKVDYNTKVTVSGTVRMEQVQN